MLLNGVNIVVLMKAISIVKIKKKLAQDKIQIWYHQNCTQDEADAICIGKYFANKIKINTV